MHAISTDKAPKAIGPYSQAIKSGYMLFCSGQIGLDPATMELAEGLDNQVRQACENIGEVLKEAGMQYDNVVKTTIFLTDLSDFGRMNEIYAEYFTEKPARSTVEVSGLPRGALIEIEAIAHF